MRKEYSHDKFVADCELWGLDPEKADQIKMKYNQENGTFIIWASEIPYKYMKDALL